MDYATLKNGETMEVGCVYSDFFGWHINYMVIQLAWQLGMPKSPVDEALVYAFANPGVQTNRETVNELILDQGGLLDQAEEWLNENLAPDGYEFGFFEGSFFFADTGWWREVGGSDEEC